MSSAGVRITDIPLTELAELGRINSKGGFGAAESYAFHRSLLSKAARYDPRVLSRILRGRQQDAADYIDLMHARTDFIRRTHAILAPFDALLLPTVPIVAPRLSELNAEEAYRDVNLLMLRNPTIANFIDGCSISIPCHTAGEAPVGLMLIGHHGTDRLLLAIAFVLEKLLRPQAQAN